MKKMSKNILLVFLGMVLSFITNVAAEAVISSGAVSYGNTTVNAALDELFSAVDINEKIGTTDISGLGNGTITSAISTVNNKFGNYLPLSGGTVGTITLASGSSIVSPAGLTLASDGNIASPYWGGWLSNKLNDMDARRNNLAISKMKAGSIVSYTRANDSAFPVFTQADINSMLGVSNSTVYNTTVIFTNGDAAAFDSIITAFNYGGTWYGRADHVTAGAYPCRVNYLIVYWG